MTRGLLLVAAVTAVAYPLGRLVPVVGGPVFALALGIAVATSVRLPATLRGGISFAARYALQVAIVVLGATLSLTRVVHVGASSLPVMLGSLAAALVTALLLGRALRVESRLRTLVGVGTGICGASAISAVSGIIGATEAEIAYSISTIFVFNVVAVVAFPLLGHLLGLDQNAFGLWAGTAVNDTSSVVATAYAYGHTAASRAVIVKLTRTTMIIPIAIALAVAHVRRGRAVQARWTRIVPWFLLWFVLAALANTVGLVGTEFARSLSDAALVLVTFALAAVGLSTRLDEARRTGFRPLVLGAAVWAVVAGSSLALERLTGAW